MNENPGETPNPLNPASAADASSAAPASEKPAAPKAAGGTDVPQPQPNVIVESLDPSGRAMEKIPDTIPEPPKKKKTGLIVTIIIAAVIAIAGIVAAIVILLNVNSGGNQVALAMEKLMSGNGPSNVSIDGTIDLLPKDDDSPIKRVTITLDSAIKLSSGINNSTAAVTFVTNDDKKFSLEFDEIYTTDGNLYLKIEGAADALVDSGLMELFTGTNENIDVVDCNGEEDNCISDDSMSELTGGIVSIIDSIEGTWMRVSMDDLGATDNGDMMESSLTCITDLVNSIDTKSNSAIELYKKYPFYDSSDKNLTVASKANPIYKLTLNEENFRSFVNEIDNSDLAGEVYSCLGWEGNVSASIEDVIEVAKKLPEMYVEVDSNRDFTRFYAQSEALDGAEILFDLSFTYPASVVVTDPDEYSDFSDVIQHIVMSMYGISDEEEYHTVIEQ